MHLVIVDWVDAHTTENDEIAPEEVEERLHFGYPTTSHGYLIRSDSVGVTLCTDVQHGKDGSMHYRGAHFIPRQMITSERKVPLKSKRKGS